MQTYNTNPAYEMAPQLLEHFNQHLDSLFGVYSKLLPFRMDFAYRKNTLSYRCACRYAMCAEMLQLINEVGEKLVGYAWVMEYTERKGLHIHFVGYLNGQSHRSSYLVSRLMGDIWRRVTEGNGYYHWCRFNKNYPVNINHVIHYSDHKAVNDLRYAISYLAKREQKECGIILKCSGLPEKVTGVDHDWTAPCRGYVLWCKPLNDKYGLALIFAVGSGGHFSGTAHFLRRGHSV